MERVRTGLYLWLSRLAVWVGILCMVIAAVTGVTQRTLITDPHYYLQAAIAAFAFAIWSAIYGLRGRGTGTD